jgi:hypothetical protein
MARSGGSVPYFSWSGRQDLNLFLIFLNLHLISFSVAYVLLAEFMIGVEMKRNAAF